MIDDLKIIKKKYGEKMMHLCRELFPILLETPGLLSKIMLDNFESTRFLYKDIIYSNKISDFKNYIYSLINQEVEEKIVTDKTPKELFEQIGYDLYECKTELDIQRFKKYYKKGESLCTFNGGRLKWCHVFFAVRKDVENIKRENFKNPRREDDYGISVLSIQFARGGFNTLSIKNRYNHTVPNCDSTFSNNLENIVPGLTESFEREYDLNINQNKNNGFEIPGYIKANDSKYYKVNCEYNNICYCPNNIIIDNFRVKKYDKEKYIILDSFILDLQNKKIFLYDEYLKDCFVDIVGDIHSIRLENIKESGNKKIYIKNKKENEIIIEIDSSNKIIGYTDYKTEKIGNNFLRLNSSITSFEVPLLTKIGDSFLYNNMTLTSFKAPLLMEVGSDFLCNNKILDEFEAPLLISVKDNFLNANMELISFKAPNLLQVGNYFMCRNFNLKSFEAPLLLKVGDYFLRDNMQLSELNLPSILQIGEEFLSNNRYLNKFEAPKLKYISHNFLYNNEQLSILFLPSLINVGYSFLYSNQNLEKIEAPKLKYVGDNFMRQNENLTSFYAPELKEVGHCFLFNNKELKNFNFFNIKRIGSQFLPILDMSNLSPENIEKLKKIIDLIVPNKKSLYNECIKRVGKSSIFLTILINKKINQLKIKNNEIGGSHTK